jgi:hypothetical protein
LQSESDPQLPHVPLEQRPMLQSESEPHAPHFPPEHRPELQSESEPHAPQRPLEQRPNPLQSESEPQLPHFPLEHLPNPLQSESEPHSDAQPSRSSRASGARVMRTRKRPLATRRARRGWREIMVGTRTLFLTRTFRLARGNEAFDGHLLLHRAAVRVPDARVEPLCALRGEGEDQLVPRRRHLVDHAVERSDLAALQRLQVVCG